MSGNVKLLELGPGKPPNIITLAPWSLSTHPAVNIDSGGVGDALFRLILETLHIAN